MATYLDPNKDKEDQYGSQASSAPQTSSPSGTIQGGASATPTGSSTNATGRQGTGYVNLQKYLNANQGRGADMAQNLSGNISKDAESAKTALDNDTKQFNKAVDNNVYRYDYNKLATGEDAQRAVDAQTWKGPQQYSNQGLQQQVDSANQRIQGTADPNNVREQWTAQNNTSGNYGGGKASFDSSLMQGDTQANQVFKELQKTYSNYGNTYTDAQSKANDYAKAGADLNASNYNKARAASGDIYKNLGSTISAANRNTVSQRQAELESERARLQSEDDARVAAVDFWKPHGAGQSYLYNTQGPKVGNIYSGADSTQIARMNALAALSGNARISGTAPLFVDQGKVDQKLGWSWDAGEGLNTNYGSPVIGSGSGGRI